MVAFLILAKIEPICNRNNSYAILRIVKKAKSAALGPKDAGFI
jgi:hypothetical protein